MTQVTPGQPDPPKDPAQETAQSAQETAQSAQETAQSAQESAKSSRRAKRSAKRSEPTPSTEPSSDPESTTESPKPTRASWGASQPPPDPGDANQEIEQSPETPPTEQPPPDSEESNEEESSDDPQRADQPQDSDEAPVKARFASSTPEPRVVLSEEERTALEHLARALHNERTGGGEVHEGELQAAREEHLRRTAGVES